MPTTSALAEYGPGQYEVNLAHGPDALRACDEALRFKRIVKSVARKHGCEATFLPKPYRDMAGSGLHIHVSLLDSSGRNLFAAASADESPPLRHAIAGTLVSLGDGMAILRAGAEFLPALPSRSLRADPSDVVGQQPRLGGARAGIRRGQPAARAPARGRGRESVSRHRLDPRRHPPWTHTQARAAAGHDRQRLQQSGEPLPLVWSEAIDRFASSGFAKQYFGEKFTHLFATVKRAEMQEFNSHVTPLEVARYLGPL